MDTLDRSDADHAREIIEWMIPNSAVRADVLNCLSETIIAAHNERDSAWGITLFPGLIRLNVGMPEAFTFTSERVYLVLDEPSCPTSIWKKHGVTQYVYDQSTPNRLFRSVLTAIGCSFPPRQISTVYPLAQQSHLDLLHKSAKTRRNPKTKIGHSPGILKYLRQETRKDIPDPVYPPPPSYIYFDPEDEVLTRIRREMAERDWSIRQDK